MSRTGSQQWLLELGIDAGDFLRVSREVIAESRKMYEGLGDDAQAQAAVAKLNDLEARLDGVAAGYRETGEAASTAADGLATTGDAADKAGDPLKGAGSAAQQLGGRLGQVAGSATEAGQALLGLAAGAMGPVAAGIMVATAAITADVNKLREMQQEIDEANRRLVEHAQRWADASAGMREYYAGLSRAAGAPPYPDMAAAGDLAALVGERGGLSEEAAQRVALASQAAGMEGREAGLFAEAVGAGAYGAEDARRFAARYRDRGHDAMREEIAPAVSARDPVELAQSRARARAAGEAAKAGRMPENQIRAVLVAGGLKEDDAGRLVDEAMGRASTWRNATAGDITGLWGIRAREAQQNPRMLSAMADLGLQFGSGGRLLPRTEIHNGQVIIHNHYNRDPDLGSRSRNGTFAEEGF